MPPKVILECKDCKDRISALPDDLLVQILLFLPTEDAVITMILSKLWRLIWTMIPKLDYNDRYKRCTAINPTLPKSLYTCRTLLKLTLSNNIGVDVFFFCCLGSLQQLNLFYVVWKYEDSHVTLLSSCPVLKNLSVLRDEFDDNVTTFIVKVPSLENLIYERKSRSRHEVACRRAITFSRLKSV
ncbi:hypothetical protein YC2023_093903 [Brassica napus]